MSGYLIPKQEIPETEDRAAVLQRPEGIRIFRSKQIDTIFKDAEKDPSAKELLPHPRMEKVKGRVFTVETTEDDGQVFVSVKHESELDKEAVKAFDKGPTVAASEEKPVPVGSSESDKEIETLKETVAKQSEQIERLLAALPATPAVTPAPAHAQEDKKQPAAPPATAGK